MKEKIRKDADIIMKGLPPLLKSCVYRRLIEQIMSTHGDNSLPPVNAFLKDMNPLYPILVDLLVFQVAHTIDDQALIKDVFCALRDLMIEEAEAGNPNKKVH